jgi:hypothetical protein
MATTPTAPAPNNYLATIDNDLATLKSKVQSAWRSGNNAEDVRTGWQAGDSEALVNKWRTDGPFGGVNNPVRPLMEKIMELEGQRAQEASATNPTTQITGNIELDRTFQNAKPFAENLFGEGKLGRIGEQRSTDVADIIARRREALGGMSSTENQAAKDQLFNQVNRDTQTNLRALRGIQGATGQNGGAAVNQQIGVLGAGQSARKDLERDLMLKNIDLRGQALNNYETSVAGAETNEQNQKIFNLDQISREKEGMLTTQFGLAGLGQAERASLRGLSAVNGVLASAGVPANSSSILSQLRMR